MNAVNEETPAATGVQNQNTHQGEPATMSIPPTSDAVERTRIRVEDVHIGGQTFVKISKPDDSKVVLDREDVIPLVDALTLHMGEHHPGDIGVGEALELTDAIIELVRSKGWEAPWVEVLRSLVNAVPVGEVE